MPLLYRKRILTAAVESTYGVDAAPTGSNAILVRNLNVTPIEADMVDRSLVRPYLGRSEQLLAGTRVRLECEIEMAGSGAAGTAPGFGPLLRGCGLSQTLLATALTGTATAGTTNSITLAAGASAVDGFYVGMPITLTGGTGSGQTAVITGYVGSTRVATVARNWTTAPNATSQYSIPANAIYRPISDTFPSLTMHYNNDGVRHRLLGARGSASLAMTVKDIPVIRLAFTGIYSPPTDTPAVTPDYTPFQTPLPVTNVNTPYLALHGFAPVMSELSMDMSAQIVHRTLVGGSEQVMFTDRQPQGQIKIEADTIAAADWYARITGVTLGTLGLIHGTVAGNRVAVASPRVQLMTPAVEDMDGLTMLSMGASFVPTTVGNDEFSLCFF